MGSLDVFSNIISKGSIIFGKMFQWALRHKTGSYLKIQGPCSNIQLKNLPGGTQVPQCTPLPSSPLLPINQTLLLDPVTRPSYWTLLVDLVILNLVTRHSYQTLLLDLFTKPSYQTYLQNLVTRPSYKTQLLDL